MKNDWRLTNQKQYLDKATLVKKNYTKKSDKWEHDHCEFCFEKFSTDIQDSLKDGYCTQDEKHWICNNCYNDFKEMFNWKEIE